MLRIGTTNYIENATVSATGTNPSFPADNVKTPALSRWQSSTTLDTLTITFPTKTVDLIVLFNCRFSTLTAVGKNGGATQFTANLTNADLDGVDFQNVVVRTSSATIDTLELTFNGGAAVPFVGFVHVGLSATFNIESYQPFIESTAQAERTIGGIVETNPGYSFRQFNVTVVKNDYTYADITAIMRPILAQYSYPRAFIFDADCTLNEAVLGVLDSNRIGFDPLPIQKDGKYTAQFTIGITEVFAGGIR
jgi:hypothetical protein